jgi:hypothetical protein
MPITYLTEAADEAGGAACAVFEGVCAPEEADGLLEWLRAAPDAACDLTACGDLHTSLLQLLLAGRVRLAAAPADKVLASCLAGLPTGAAAGRGREPADLAEAPQPPARARRRARAAAEQQAAVPPTAPVAQVAPVAPAAPVAPVAQVAQAVT